MYKRILLTALVVSTLMGCSAKNIPLVEDNFPSFDIEGQWAVLGSDDWQNEIMIDFRKTDQSDYELKVWGQLVQLDSFQQGTNQFLFTYTHEGQQIFTVLGTVLSNEQVKLSRTSEVVHGFQPVGKLGEKVYYLQRLSEGEPYMLTKAPKKKKSAMSGY